MKKPGIQRRHFIRSIAASGLAFQVPQVVSSAKTKGKLAMAGGKPVRTEPFPSWPIVDDRFDEDWNTVLYERKWCRWGGGHVSQFEKNYAQLMGVQDCIATSSGTCALIGSLNGCDISAGDEVLVPPYTFVATINVVFLQHAMPVFVDTDPQTFQMDAQKIEERITERTRAIIPVHLGGNSCDMDAIMSIAKKHDLVVIEDACQAHMGEWRGQKVGSIGDCGCFSFQVSKNLCSGEGGAIISNKIPLMDRIYSFHTNGRERSRPQGFQYINNGMNMRMTEFQGVLLNEQLPFLELRARIRESNARYLTKQLDEIPGIQSAKMYPGCTRNAYHLYMFRYDKSHFSGLHRDTFIEALRKEGIPCSRGYTPLNKEPLIEKTVHSRSYRQVFSDSYIDRYLRENQCPANDQLCKEEAVWFFQSMLLGSKKDMDHIAEAIRKIHRHAGSLA